MSSFRVGLGYDVHAFGGDGALVLGGVTVAGEPGLSGHSDADVVAHAVADAVLGPAGLPDLGTLFPASDDRYRGASSLELLRQVAERVAAAGWRIVNIDVVIAAEQPLLAPHLGEIVANLVDALDSARRRDEAPVFVSVKPKRGEGLDSVGRGEGIAAWAIA